MTLQRRRVTQTLFAAARAQILEAIRMPKAVDPFCLYKLLFET